MAEDIKKLEADDKKLVESHICDYYEDTDRNSRLLNEASLMEDFGSRDRKMKEWAKHWEESTGATEEDIIKQNEGRR